MPYRQNKGQNDKVTTDSMQSRRTGNFKIFKLVNVDFESTSAQFQNMLTSKYDVGLDTMLDFRRHNYTDNIVKTAKRDLRIKQTYLDLKM